MPARLKLGLTLVGGASLLLATALVTALARTSPALGVLAAAALLGSGAFVLFVFEPRFDPTGSTLWRRRTAERIAALTFDDGPSPHTAAILDALAAHRVRATFFFLGDNARRHPELVERARAAGHAVGSHGLSHRKLHRAGVADIDRELRDAEPLLGPLATVHGRPLLRVPHGFKSLRLVRRVNELGYQLVAWTAGVWDSDRPGADVIAARLRRALAPGAVLLLHDGDGCVADPDRAQTAQALESFLEDAARRGYRLVTLPELFA
jgi:peptidoglycan/xylan/chitin deacetylase (PgdA/CDA1 family)